MERGNSLTRRAMTVSGMSDDEKIPPTEVTQCGASRPVGTVWSYLLSCLLHRSARRHWRASVSVSRLEETSLRWDTSTSTRFLRSLRIGIPDGACPSQEVRHWSSPCDDRYPW